jgi:hypothetical protein
MQKLYIAMTWDSDTMNTIGLNCMLKVAKENREHTLVKWMEIWQGGDPRKSADKMFAHWIEAARESAKD